MPDELCGRLVDLAFSPDGTALRACSFLQSVVVELDVLDITPSFNTSLAFSPDETQLYITTREQRIYTFDVASAGLQLFVQYPGQSSTFGLAVAPYPLGDFDVDADVDWADRRTLVHCLRGPATAKTDACKFPDADRDGDVDLLDFSMLQETFTGGQRRTRRDPQEK